MDKMIVDTIQTMTMLDWFATFAPEPTKDEITVLLSCDKLVNPHNDSYKPRRRTEVEIICELKYRYAKAMYEVRRKIMTGE